MDRRGSDVPVRCDDCGLRRWFALDGSVLRVEQAESAKDSGEKEHSIRE